MTDSFSPERYVLTRFHSRLLEDQLAGEARDLADYLDEVPEDHWPPVARAWLGATSPEHGALDGPDTEPEALGPYRLIAELGRGGQGTVHLAEDSRLGRQVALKVLEGLRSASEEATRRLRREAEAASRLDDPGICTVYETGVVNGTPFIAMQYLEGQTLAEAIAATREASPRDQARPVVLGCDLEAAAETGFASDDGSPRSRSRRRDVDCIVKLIAKIAGSLHAAHTVGVLHRDVKPANLMLAPSGDPVVLDFGLAHVESSRGATLTRPSAVFGTPAYMSPEQITAGADALDARTDVWSLGVVLYECLTCRRPFAAPSREALYHVIAIEDPLDVRTLVPAVSRDLRSVVEKALEKEPRRRYATALEFAEDLRRVLDREPVHARAVTRWTRCVRWSQRNRGVAAGLVAAFSLLIVALIASLAQLRNEEARAGALRREAQTFARYRQLADPALARTLIQEARDLWPRRKWMIPRLDDWLSRARAVRDRIEIRMAELADLRDRALPPEPEDDEEAARLRRQRCPELMSRIEAAERACARLEERIAKAPERRRERLEERREELQDELAELRADPRCEQRLVWRFSELADRQVHRALADHEVLREEFVDLIIRVEARRSFALTIAERFIDDHRTAWDRCRANLAASARYGHLELAPQIGLVPLGIDADSGLWEFWTPGSGERPHWSGAPLAGKAEIDDESGMVLVLLPGGTFLMGAQREDATAPNHDPAARDDEAPVHAVTLTPFFIAKHEVTQGQWKRLMGFNPSDYRPAADGGYTDITYRHPVERVSWREATDLARRLDLELPTEAQWEYAARAGTEGPRWTGADRAALAAINLADATGGGIGIRPIEADVDDGHDIHAPVGTYPPNPFGLHEVLGNVWEVCRDCLAPYRRPVAPRDGVRAEFSVRGRIARGGSFSSAAGIVRCTNRGENTGGGRTDQLGVRLARRIRP